MKNIKTYVDESIFAGDIEDKIKDINASLTLPQPKTPVEYLNYMGAWMIWIDQIYNSVLMTRSLDKKDANDLLEYLFNLYAENLPNYHIDLNALKKMFPYLEPDKYNIRFDDFMVKSGKTPFDKSYLEFFNTQSINFKYCVFNVLTGEDPSKKSRGWVISFGSHMLLFRSLGLTKQYLSDAMQFIVGLNSQELRRMNKRIEYWIITILEAVRKSPYKDLLKNITII